MSTHPAIPTAGPHARPPSGADDRLSQCAARIVGGDGVPPFSHHAQEVMVHAVNPEVSLTDITRTVLKDLGLTSQILRVANSSIYNRSGKPILSVAHCVSLLGADAVRDHVSALRFLEQFVRRAPGLRELAALSLLTANHGRQFAGMVGYPRPEEAYICALFSNLGEILAARFLPAEYSRITLAMSEAGVPDRVACLRALGFSWHDLAARVSGLWNLPEKVRLCIESREQPTLARSPLDLSLCSITRSSHNLTSSVYRKLNPANARDFLLDPNGRKHVPTSQQIERTIELAQGETLATLASLGLSAEGLPFQAQVPAAREFLTSPEPLDDDIGEAPLLIEEVRDPVEAVQSALDRAEQLLRAESFDVVGTLQAVLDALGESAVLQRSIFAMVTQSRDSIEGRLGWGEQIGEAVRAFSFRLRPLDVLFAVTLGRRQDLVVRRDTDGRYDRTRLVATLGPQAFGFFPVVADNLAIGCLYVDTREAHGMLPDWLRPHLERARDLIGRALERASAAR